MISIPLKIAITLLAIAFSLWFVYASMEEAKSGSRETRGRIAVGVVSCLAGAVICLLIWVWRL